MKFRDDLRSRTEWNIVTVVSVIYEYEGTNESEFPSTGIISLTSRLS